MISSISQTSETPVAIAELPASFGESDSTCENGSGRGRRSKWQPGQKTRLPVYKGRGMLRLGGEGRSRPDACHTSVPGTILGLGGSMLLQDPRNRGQLNRPRISSCFMILHGMFLMVLIGAEASTGACTISSLQVDRGTVRQLAEDNRIRDLPIMAAPGQASRP